MSNKVGTVIIVVGRQGSGKSPTIKELAKVSGMTNLVVYDRRNEYNPAEWTQFFKLEIFTKQLQKITDSFIVIEEATGFISGFKDQELTDILIGVEHNRNILVFVFHSLIDLPPYIQRLGRFIYLFPTNDVPEVIERSRPNLFPYFKKTGKKNAQGHNKPVLVDVYDI